MKASGKSNERESMTPLEPMTKIQLALAKYGFSLSCYLKKCLFKCNWREKSSVTANSFTVSIHVISSYLKSEL